MNKSLFFITLLLISFLGACASNKEVIPFYTYSPTKEVLNTNLEKSETLLIGQWQLVADRRLDGRRTLPLRIDKYNIQPKNRAILIDTINGFTIKATYSVLDRNRIRFVFNNPYNGKEMKRDFEFSISEYQGMRRLEFVVKKRFFSFLGTDDILNNQKITGLWKDQKTEGNKLFLNINFDNSGKFTIFNEPEKRAGGGYYYLFENTQKELWLSMNLFVSPIGSSRNFLV